MAKKKSKTGNKLGESPWKSVNPQSPVTTKNQTPPNAMAGKKKKGK